MRGSIVIEAGANVWPHELETAKALAAVGMSVNFLRRAEGKGMTSADVEINGVVWEMKAPLSASKKAIERNLRGASRQSHNIVLDIRRMKGARGAEVRRSVVRIRGYIKEVRRLLYIDWDGSVSDLS